MLRDIRYAPDGINLPILIYLFDDKVAFVNGRLGQQFAAVLESKEVHTSLQSLFEYLWGISEAAKEIGLPSSRPKSDGVEGPLAVNIHRRQQLYRS